MRKQKLISTASLLVISLLVSHDVLAQQPQKRTPNPVKKAPAGLTLRQFRQIFLNQRIVILQGSDIRGSLGSWLPMKQDLDSSVPPLDFLPNAVKNDFVHDLKKGAFIAYKYKDQTPKVIDIREKTLFQAVKEGQKNALGETMTDNDIVDPFVRVIVQFDDGQLAEYDDLVSDITDFHSPDHWDMQFMPESVRDAHAEIINANLQSIIGQKVYAVHDSSPLFAADTTTEEILDPVRRGTKMLDDVPLLSPMTIVAARYNDRYDFVVSKLQLRDGRELISASRYQDDANEAGKATLSFLRRVTGTLPLKIPPDLTAQEIGAIRARKIFRGMSRQALLYSWGGGRENDYGRGGKQLVYGKQFVYLDANGRVTDWQTIR